MICDICGKTTDIIFHLPRVRICEDCATLSVAQLANEGWVDVEEETFLTVPAFIDGVPVDEEKKNSNEVTVVDSVPVDEKKKLNKVTVVDGVPTEEKERKIYCLYSGSVVDPEGNEHCAYAIDAGVNCDTCPHKYDEVDEAHDFADREGKSICHCLLLDIDVVKGSKPAGCEGEGDCDSCAHCVDFMV